MENFTVKDFITNYNPCFCCRVPVNFKIGVYVTSGALSDICYLRPVVNNTYTEIDLKINYMDSIKLFIDHKTNNINTNNASGLEKYLESHLLFLSTDCPKCTGYCETRFLEFDLKRNVILPATIMSECLVVYDKETTYIINSSFNAKTSNIHVYKRKTSSDKDINLNLPLLPKSKFKDRKHLLEKLKLYILFS